MVYKIQNIKDFLKNGPPQFDVVSRHEKGKTINMEFKSVSEDWGFHFKESVTPATDEGVIKAVRRLCDNQIFHVGDWSECDEGSCFILSFSEDKIHCDVITMDSDGEKMTIEIDEVVFVISGEEEPGTNEVAVLEKENNEEEDDGQITITL